MDDDASTGFKDPGHLRKCFHGITEMLYHHIARDHIKTAVAKGKKVGRTKHPSADAPVFADTRKIHIASHDRTGRRYQSVFDGFQIVTKQAMPASQVQPPGVARYVSLQRCAVDLLVPNKTRNNPFHQEEGHARPHGHVPEIAQSHRAPLPSSTILTV